MELNQTEPQLVSANLGDIYLRQLKRKTTAAQFSLTLVVATASTLALHQPQNPISSVLIFAGLFVSIGLVTTLIRQILLNPLAVLIDSLFPLSQARHSTQKISFARAEQAILQQIFNFKTPAINQDNTNQLHLDAMDRAQFGLISFDPNLKLNYVNTFAKKLLDIQSHLNLDFADQIDLHTWIKQAQEQKIDDHRTWQALAFIDPETNQRFWFNLSADFHKSTVNETLVLITPTDEPAKAQQDFDFIAYAAHELRGPITIIRGYLDILQNDFPNKSTTGQVIMDRLTVAGNRLSGYINNILNVAKLDQKSFKLNLKLTDPANVIDEIYDDIQLRAKTNQKNLIIEVEPNLPNIPLDRISLTQAITNLVDNAIKYSKPGDSVKISVFRNNTEISFQITDQGIGMPPNVVNNLFKRFYRSHRTQNQVGGTGIGLFITKAVVDAHQGNITVSSEVGQGSTFTINLPINPDKVVTSTGFIQNHGLIRK